MDDDARERFRKCMEAGGWKPGRLSKAAGLGETFVRDMLAGTRPSVENLEKLTRILGVTVAYILEGQAPEFQRVVVIGESAAGETWTPHDNGTQTSEIELRMEGGEAVGVTVRGDGLSPAYRDGDVLMGAKSLGRNVDNLIGLDCIVMTEDGRRYIRILERGIRPGTFDLRSIIVGKPDLKGLRVAWAAPVTWIRRGGAPH
jgi:repressor LexA